MGLFLFMSSVINVVFHRIKWRSCSVTFSGIFWKGTGRTLVLGFYPIWKDKMLRTVMQNHLSLNSIIYLHSFPQRPNMSNLLWRSVSVSMKRPPPHLGPVVQLLQQVFVQVGRPDGCYLLAPDQSLQLLPRRLQVSQTLVSLQRRRRRDDDRVQLGHCQSLTSWRWETEMKSVVAGKTRGDTANVWDAKLTQIHSVSDGGLARLAQEELHCKDGEPSTGTFWGRCCCL